MKKIFILVLGIIIFGISMSGVSAATISYKKLDNIYFNLKVDGVSSSNYVTMFYLDGRLAYCIEPGAAINTKTYNADSNWSKTSFSVDKQRYLEKIGYYGYEYPGHQTPRYYIATQELIWKAIKNVDITWTTGANGSGSVIDVSKEKNEILSLIEKHGTVPSFAGDVISGEKGTTTLLEDYNGVLDKFDISESKIHKLEKTDEGLNITFSSDIAEEEITLTRKNQYSDLLLVYTMSGSQALASLRISTPEVYSFKLKSVEIPKEKPKKEIVRVPSTGNSDSTKHFKVIKYYNYDNKHFD